MTQPEVAISRAVRAAQVLNDPLVQEVLTAMKTEVAAMFFETASADAERRESLHRMDVARRQFEAAFKTLIVGGQVEAHERNAEEEARRVQAVIDEQLRTR